MTNISHPGEPRSRTILRHTRKAVADGALRVLPFSEAVAERYLADTRPDQRTVNLREQGETMDAALKAQRANGQVIDRLVQGIVHTFPADLEDAWVQCLPEPYRQHCEQDLAARRGHLPVQDPRAAAAPAQQTANLGELLAEMGETAIALAPIFADGKVDASDLQHIGPALEQLGDLLTKALQLHTRLAAVVIDAPAPSNVSTLRRA
ncbi:hypothetical protein A7A76_07700 [Lysobacter enzymogenes]|uniref:hypothetical protein n=1 Tax=Lysobacter enzymogenes TaxID=69 RepID=UPI0019D1735A|nr:hypothetical protein [Lysobacter enzymogenes]MBN7138977.1 hypothetical protein [Lysobacter enzymogenes]